MEINRVIERLASCSIIPFDADAQEISSVAIAAIQEKQEREKGCEFCSGNDWRDRKNIPLQGSHTQAEIVIDTDNSIYVSNMDDDISINTVEIKFCPMCGRKLSENNG
ncbi:hypothetical protein [Faecalispora jeddahensis]|uniref:hypothetical protein n=1 Tax=Faecalispora jeddahensis TaxID=1414721 RepID=UPI00189A9709|nr:hypothetical protein [Faecalispora jeddahensis]